MSHAPDERTTVTYGEAGDSAGLQMEAVRQTLAPPFEGILNA